MKLIQFSFKSEPIWMLVFSFAPAVLVSVAAAGVAFGLTGWPLAAGSL